MSVLYILYFSVILARSRLRHLYITPPLRKTILRSRCQLRIKCRDIWIQIIFTSKNQSNSDSMDRNGIDISSLFDPSQMKLNPILICMIQLIPQYFRITFSIAPCFVRLLHAITSTQPAIDSVKIGTWLCAAANGGEY